jgi:hypothetical protein
MMNRFELSQDMVIWCDFPLAVALQHRIFQTKSKPSAHRITLLVISAWCCRHYSGNKTDCAVNMLSRAHACWYVTSRRLGTSYI